MLSDYPLSCSVFYSIFRATDAVLPACKVPVCFCTYLGRCRIKVIIAAVSAANFGDRDEICFMCKWGGLAS